MIPESNNCYAHLNNTTAASIKKIFEDNGWVSRKCGWTSFELKNDWSAFELDEDKNGALLNGSVDFNPTNVATLDKLFARMANSFAYEFYDEEDNLVFEKKV